MYLYNFYANIAQVLFYMCKGVLFKCLMFISQPCGSMLLIIFKHAMREYLFSFEWADMKNLSQLMWFLACPCVWMCAPVSCDTVESVPLCSVFLVCLCKPAMLGDFSHPSSALTCRRRAFSLANVICRLYKPVFYLYPLCVVLRDGNWHTCLYAISTQGILGRLGLSPKNSFLFVFVRKSTSSDKGDKTTIE